jgi:hypothetical protein
MTAKATTTRPRTPRKPARASTGDQGTSRARKPATGRQTAKPNPFDDIARQVNADQEAKDREVGRDDLTPALSKSVDQAKVKRSGTSRAATKPVKPARPAKPATPAKPVKPTVPTKVRANGKPTTTFKGRPTSNPTTIAARAKEAGLRVRKDADPADIATRLRATVEATTAWLESRNGSAPAPKAKATATAPKAPAPKAPAPKAKESKAPVKDAPAPKEPKAPTILVGHRWEGPTPDGLPEIKGCTLAVRYTVQLDDGLIVSQLWGVRNRDGKHIADAWQWPLDFRPKAEVSGRGRKVTLKDRTKAGLQAWLAKEGLTNK